MEDQLRNGNLDWTTIRPPRLTNAPLTGTYRTAIDRNVRHGLTISRPDVAHLILTVLQQRETIRHAIGVADEAVTAALHGISPFSDVARLGGDPELFARGTRLTIGPLPAVGRNPDAALRLAAISGCFR